MYFTMFNTDSKVPFKHSLELINPNLIIQKEVQYHAPKCYISI